MSKRGHNKTLEHQKRVDAIQSDFDERLDDIVIVMRKQGCKWATIAGSLDISRSTLTNWRKYYGFGRPSRDIVRYEEKSGGKSPIEDIAKQHGYKSFADLYRDMRLTKKMTVRQVADTIGVSLPTVQKWTPKELKDMRLVTEKNNLAAIENLKKARLVPRKEGHQWDKQFVFKDRV